MPEANPEICFLAKNSHRRIYRLYYNILLFCIEVNKSGYRTSAHRAEFWILISTHTAICTWTVNAFNTVSSTFVQRYSVDFIIYHVCPFAAKIFLGCDVWFPWLNIVRVCIDNLFLIGIFVSQSGKTVSELVNDNRTELAVVCHGEIIGIIYTASAVFSSVDKHDDVFVRCACQPVVHTF